MKKIIMFALMSCLSVMASTLLKGQTPPSSLVNTYYTQSEFDAFVLLYGN